MKKYILLVIIFCITGIIAGCGDVSEFSCEKDSDITYTRLQQTLASLKEDVVPYIGEEEIEGKYYWKYGNDEVTMMIEFEYTDEMFAEYQFCIEDELVYKENLRYDCRHFSRNELYYVDINNDWSKDLVLKIDISGGTDYAYHWREAYDLKNEKKINLFSDEDYLLTSEQKEQLDTMLSNDKEFQNIVGDFAYYGPYVNPFVDASGRVYLYLSVAKEPQNYPVEVCAFLEYNREKAVFEVQGYDYIFY